MMGFLDSLDMRVVYIRGILVKCFSLDSLKMLEHLMEGEMGNQECS